MGRKQLWIAIATFLWVSIASFKLKAQSTLSSNQRLTGTWQGLRSSLEGKGISIESMLIGDVMANVRGGVQREGSFIENWDLSASLDLQPLIGWRGGRIHFAVLQNNGGAPSTYIGDVQTVNNIEAVQTIRLYEWWIQQNMFENRLSLLAGVYDINFEFDVMQSAALFINSSQGLGGEMAASGLVGPPTFPATAPSVRIKVMPNPSVYLQTAISNGTPSVDHVSWHFSKEDGVFWIGELGFLFPRSKKTGHISAFYNRRHIGRSKEADYLAKIALGGWAYSRNYLRRRYAIDRSDRKNEKGIYLLCDLRSLGEFIDQLDGLAWHLRLGIADNKLSRMHFFIGTGFTYDKILWDNKGEVGFSISAVQNSNAYKQAVTEGPDFEVALEWTYRTKITPWLNMQPDIQNIINPGMRPEIGNAWVIGLRTEVQF